MTLERSQNSQPGATGAHEALRLKQRAVRGGLSVLARAIAVRGIAFVGLILIARLASPAELGAFVMVSFAVGFFTAVGDGGLAAALIQQDHEPTPRELSTVFTGQAMVVAGLAVGGLALSIPLAGVLHLGAHQYATLLLVMAALPFAALKTVPAARLERQLRYGPIAAVDALQAFVFQGLAVGFAVAGFGVEGFAAAAVVQAAVGAIAVTAFSPWWLHFGLDRPSLRRLFSFGAIVQAQTAVNYVKDSITPLFVGAVVGASAVGYLNWAYTMAAIPLLIAYPLADVTFSVFARARGDLVLLQAMVERAIRVCALTILPVSILTIVGAGRLVDVVFGAKWAPSLPALYIFAVGMCTCPLITSSFFSLFYATGRTRTALGFMIAWAVLDWGLGVPLVLHYGFVGIAWRSLLVAAASTPVLIITARRIVPLRVLRQVTLPAILACAAGAVEWVVYSLTSETVASTLLGLLLALSFFVVLACLFERRLLAATVRALRPTAAAGVRAPVSASTSPPS